MTAAPLDISEIKRRLEEQASNYIPDVEEFQRHAPTDIAALLAEVARLQALLSTAYEDAAKVAETHKHPYGELPFGERVRISSIGPGIARDIRALAAKNGAVR